MGEVKAGRTEMSHAPAVTIHSLEQAQLAARIAAELGRPVTLLSATGAAAYVGPGWFAGVVAAARTDSPEAGIAAYLDCGDRSGDALAAFRADTPGVVFTGRADVADKLAALAEAHGVAFLRARPDALDLLDRDDPGSAVRAHLQAG